MLVIIVATSPDVLWDLVPWIVFALTIAGAFATHPFSRSLWLAVDLLFRPAERHDFAPDERPAQ